MSELSSREREIIAERGVIGLTCQCKWCVAFRASRSGFDPFRDDLVEPTIAELREVADIAEAVRIAHIREDVALSDLSTADVDELLRTGHA